MDGRGRYPPMPQIINIKAMRYIKLCLILSATVMLICSCSIKEERGVCPSWLTVDYSAFGKHVGNVVAFGWNSEKVAYVDTCEFLADSTGFCVHKVEKSPTVSTVLGGIKRMLISENRLIIPKGQSFDPIIAFSERVECSNEESVSIAKPQKHFTRVWLKLEGGAENSPYYFMISSDVAGLSLLNLSPLEGEFQAFLTPSTDDRCFIDIPRQLPDSDALTLSALVDGKVRVSVNLASMLREQGFKWDSVNLDDVTIGLNYSEAGVSVDIKEWEEGNNLEIIY